MTSGGVPAGEDLVAELTALLGASSERGELPGAILSVGRHSDVLCRVVVGDAQRSGGPRRPISEDLLFDLASLTKVVATVPALLVLVERGALAWEDPVVRYLPRFTGGGRDEVTALQLVTHTAGLPATERFYRRGLVGETLVDALYSTPLAARPGEQVCYSDLGYMLAGLLAEATSRQSFVEFTAAEVFAPAGMTGACWRPVLPAERFVATECYEGVARVGRVHDGNAFALGGVAGHAGLFATVADIEHFASAFLRTEGPWLGHETRISALAPKTVLPGGRRALGWVCAGDPAYFLGHEWPATAVTHTGFTGVSLVLDLERSAWAVLLTNALHAGRDNPAVAGVRRDVHRLAAALLTAERLTAH